MKTFIAVPCMDMLHTEFAKSLIGMRLEGEVEISFAMSSLVYDSRNILAENAIKKGFDRILWLDSDMSFDSDLFMRLSADLDLGLDYVSGVYVTRKDPIKPCVYESVTPGVKAVPFESCPNEIFKIAGSGFGAVMMTTKLLSDVGAEYGHPFSPMPGLGEDLSFCYRAAELGYPLMCDGRIRLGHLGTRMYTP